MILMVFFTNTISKSLYADEYYKIEQPYRQDLKKYYTDIYNEDENKEILDVNNVHKQYYAKAIELETQEKNIEATKSLREQQIFYAKEEQSKREQYLQNKQQESDDVNTTMEKKEQSKSWIDNWLVSKDVKPFDYIGSYSSAKLMLIWPLDIKFTADQITPYGTNKVKTDLFNGKAYYGIMPALYLAFGSDKVKYWRWEVELGYLPIRANKIKDVITNIDDHPYSNFSPTTKQLSVHVLNINLNNYAQYAFFNKSIVGFVGLGIGLGYAWSWDKILSSNFILPVITGQIGITFMLTKERKMSVAYRMSYMNFKINNKYRFVDNNNPTQSTGSIIGGGLSFKDLIVQGITIEYKFYTN